MSNKILGGANLPVEVVTTAPGSKVAVPVYGLTTLDRPLLGGPRCQVYIVSQLQIDSGEYKLLGGPAQPVYEIASRDLDQQGSVVPVYVVGGTLGATASPILILDEFTDANGTLLDAHTIAPTNIPGNAWVETAGSFDIQINQANNSASGGTTPRGLATANVAIADAIVTVTVTPVNGSISGVAGRVQDGGNLWAIVVSVADDTFAIVEWVGNNDTIRDSAAVTITAGTPYTIVVTFNGTNITATLNGANEVTFTSVLYQTETGFGLVERSAVTGTTWDDFTVESL